MIPWEEIKKYLPQYLSSESTKVLFEALEQFPENIDSRLYAINLLEQDILFQGDGVKDMPIANLPDSDIYTASVMVLSNTCDSDLTKKIYCA